MQANETVWIRQRNTLRPHRPMSPARWHGHRDVVVGPVVVGPFSSREVAADFVHASRCRAPGVFAQGDSWYVRLDLPEPGGVRARPSPDPRRG